MVLGRWLFLLCAGIGGPAVAAEGLPAPFDDAAARVITCRVRREGRVLKARIAVGDGTEQAEAVRELVSRQEDCQELAEAVALALVIASHPLIVVAPDDPDAPAPPTVKPEEPAPAPRPNVRATEAPVLSAPAMVARPHAFELRLGARAETAVGLDPGLAYGGALSLGLRRRSLSASVEWRVLAPSSVAVERGTFHIWQWSVIFAPCAHRDSLAACLLGAAGMLYGRAEGFAVDGRSSSATVAVGARGAWSYPVLGERLGLAVNLDVLAPVTRTRFTLADREGWSVSPIGASLGVGMYGAFF